MDNTFLLGGKTALVTGGGSGIGRAIALAYSREGANVLVADVSLDGGSETIDLIRSAGGNALFQFLDVTQPDDHLRAVELAQKKFGELHIACNNAGISVGPSGTYQSLVGVDLLDWTRILDVNLSGVFYGLRAQIPALLRAGGGAVVNVASIMSQVAKSGLGPYVASKHGVLGLTRTAAVEYASQGVRVNAVGPGYIDTPILERRDAATREVLKGLHPIGRLGRPDEVAEVVVWLSSMRASFVTGSYYPVDGGFLAQ
ncbi:MAG: short-chain dehydrogenase [Betaproteobacteria bacterium HGW-Betaproteobacteria-5]|nr:MAG: short-chain dehydrogenase [Betaproteobacteria bacterium HGW-Betaproteobacteria-5]PKO41163.1 MAG: short-chain dehydrogenase [Betaproteobacteria bacterium HGW-Betaproteobacteria-6]